MIHSYEILSGLSVILLGSLKGSNGQSAIIPIRGGYGYFIPYSYGLIL